MEVLLLSVKAGYGHHSTAKAIMEYFEENGHQCHMLDIFDYVNHRLGNSIQDGYLLSTKYLAKTYAKAYGKLTQKDEPYDRNSLVSIFSRFVSKKLEKFVAEYDPDLIIGTHSYAGVCISILADRAAFDCPSVGIVTDFTVHPFWESTFLDYYVIPDELLEHEMQKKGIAKKKLLPFGIPIREQFVKKNDPIEARKKLGIENIPTILIMMGSMGYGNIKKILAQIDTYPKDFQVLCVCGTNKKIKSVVDECEWNKKIYSYGFVDNVVGRQQVIVVILLQHLDSRRVQQRGFRFDPGGYAFKSDIVDALFQLNFPLLFDKSQIVVVNADFQFRLLVFADNVFRGRNRRGQPHTAH